MLKTLRSSQVVEVSEASLESLDRECAFHQSRGEGFMHRRVHCSEARHYKEKHQFRVIDRAYHLRTIYEVSY